MNDTNASRSLSILEDGSGNDTVSVGNAIFNHVLGVVSVAGNGGNDLLEVDDHDEPNGLIYTVTATSIAGNNGSATVSFTGMNSVRLYGSSGPDIYNVTGTGGRASNVVQTSIVNNTSDDFVNILATTHPLTVLLGRRGATVNVSSTAHNLNTIQGNVTINTSTGSGVINVDDQANTSSGLTYTLTGNSVTRTGAASISYSPVFEVVVNAATETGGNVYNVTGTQSGFNTLNLNNGGTSGHDTVNVQATSGPLTVNGPAFGETVNVGNAGGVQAIRGSLFLHAVGSLTVNDSPDTVARSVTMAVDALGDATITGLAPAVITYDRVNVFRVTVDGGSGGNTFTVQGTVTNGLSPVTTINSGSGNDAIDVGDTFNTLNEILGALTVNGQAGFDTLNVNDQGSTTPHLYTVTATTVTRSPGGPVITYLDMESLILHPGAHFGPEPGSGSTVEVDSTDAATAVEIDAGGGVAVNVGNEQDGLDELQGPLTVNGDGSVALTVNDQMTGAGQEYDLTQDALVRSKAAPITFTGLQGEVLNGGAGGNVFDIDGVAQGTPVQINTGLGQNLTRMRGQGLIDDALTLNSQGRDRVGYVAYTTDVYVNFQTGQATDIAALNGTFDLTGGGGTGRITGGGAGDILIGGTTAYDQDFDSLQAILSYWTTSGQSYRKRVANLRAGNGVPQLEAGVTVFDNGAANIITGNGSKAQHAFNLFYVTEAGTVTDELRREEVVDIDNPAGAPQGEARNRPVNSGQGGITLSRTLDPRFDPDLAWSRGAVRSLPGDQDMIVALTHRMALRPDDLWHTPSSDVEDLLGRLPGG